MIANYFKVALRVYSKQKVHSIINVLGLSIGLASAIFIFLYIQNELLYDHIYPNADQTYRLGVKVTDAEGNVDYSPNMPGGWGKRMVQDLEEVDGQFKFLWFGYPTSLRKKGTDNIVLTEDLFWVEASMHEFMYFPLIVGNRGRALESPNSMVISQTAAIELFGKEDPLNQEVVLKHPFITNDQEILLTVTGVFEDLPDNVHWKSKYYINYRTLAPYLQFGPNTTFEQFEGNMTSGPFHMYIHTTPGADLSKIEDYQNDLVKEVLNNNPQLQEQLAGGQVEIIVRPVKEIHWDKDVQWVSESPGDMIYIYIFGAIALMIIIIASINYMNLSTARSGKRSKEIGLRKALGSDRTQLIYQFLLESFFVVAMGFIGALILVFSLLPVFNDLASKQIQYISLWNGQLLGLLLLLLLFVGVASGAYPAFFLSGFNTIEVLKGKFSFSRGSQWFRKLLTGFQYVMALFLLMVTLVVVSQMALLQGSALNQHGETIMSIRHGGTADFNRYPAFKNLLQQDPDLQEITFANHLPRLDYFGPLQTPYRFPDINDDEYTWNALNVDYDFPSTFGLTLVAGRTFELGNVSDSASLILNETAVKALGKTPEEMIGQVMSSPTVNGYFNYDYDKLRNGRVIGVVKDFPYQSAYQAIQPLVVDPTPHFIDRILYIRLPRGKVQEKISFIESKWKEVYAGVGLDYWFVNDEFERMYVKEKRIASLSKSFSTLAILITCIGLFGLASFVAEQRTKEIGIRKAMGASNGQVLLLLLMTFLKILLLAACISVPISYLVSDYLLQNFIYRISLDPWIAVIGVGVIGLLTILTVGYESLKASLVNPVKSLRYE